MTSLGGDEQQGHQGLLLLAVSLVALRSIPQRIDRLGRSHYLAGRTEAVAL
jgi:hypothetical protein